MRARLDPQPWMAARNTRRVFEALEAVGGPGCARFVGGCVRNAVVDRPVDDIDIATTLVPAESTRALQAAGVRVVPTGIDHGTVTAIADHRPFEITSLRRDVSTDGRRAVVAFTTDWTEDAQRRDFRLNALYASLDGEIFDPTGAGLQDAREGRIVFVGDPLVRIREDYLRILRFFRFYAWFGRGEADEAALAACAELRAMLEDRPGERTHKELLKLLAAADPRPSLQLMAQTGVLGVILPAAREVRRFEAMVELERDELQEDDAELRLAALLPSDPPRVRHAAEVLRLSNAQCERLVAAASTDAELGPAMPAEALRRAIYRHGARTVRDRLKLAWAARGGGVEGWRAQLRIVDSWRAPVLPLGGNDIMALGVPRGPGVGEVLKAVEEWWIAADFPDDRAAMDAEARAAAERFRP